MLARIRNICESKPCTREMRTYFSKNYDGAFAYRHANTNMTTNTTTNTKNIVDFQGMKSYIKNYNLAYLCALNIPILLKLRYA